MSLAPLLSLACLAAPPESVERGAVFEVEQVVTGAAIEWSENPLRPLGRVRFDGPEGRTATVDLFFVGTGVDPLGGRSTLRYKARFAPDAVGRWTYRVETDGSPQVLEGAKSFECVASDRPGPPRISEDRRHFTRTLMGRNGAAGDPAPWFFLSDTAWNGVLKADPGDWGRYLDARKAQGFTAIQFVATQWRGGNETLDAKPFVLRDGRVVGVNAEVLDAMDAKVAAIVERGMAPAPVLLWALGEDSPGAAWSAGDAVLVARYLKARWGAHGCVWLLGGDGKYPEVDRWKQIGRGVFPAGESDGGGAGRGPVTLHMAGRNWVFGPYAEEPWFDFVGYQSGHGESEDDLKWLTRRAAAAEWATLDRPLVNLEPNYEAHPAYKTGRPHDARHVRRAAWWSLLIAPPAGVSYGHQAGWVWNEAAGPVEGHGGLSAGPWDDALKPEGAADMGVLRRFFESGPWTDLRPAPKLVKNQRDDPAAFVAAARTPDGKWAVIYTPAGGPLVLGDAIETSVWTRFDPRTGERASLVQAEAGVVDLPAGHDWVIEGRRE